MAWKISTCTENKQRNPLKVIYLDETWIDPHARTGKSWVPAKCTNYKIRAKYSFKRNKISRGPRIIVLNAGGEDGMFHPAMRVYPVQKKDVAGDYHDNVSGKVYIEWFKNLLTELSKTGHKYLIVQDNAPYHGSSEVSKQKDRKGTMYHWLSDNLPASDKKTFKSESSYRKFELWDLIKNLKAANSYNTIDKMAEQSGHRVLRLPPYNCDLNPMEMVWKDIKDAVRKQNADQNVNTITVLAKQIMTDYPVAKWRAHVRHIHSLEQLYWEQDGFQERYEEENHSVILFRDDDDTDDEDDFGDAVPTDPGVITSVVHDVLDADDDDELLDI